MSCVKIQTYKNTICSLNLEKIALPPAEIEL